MTATNLRELTVILGVPFDNLNMAETVNRIEAFILSGRPHYVATANVNFVAKARHDLEFMEVVRMADIITADGMPIIWASRLLGAPLKERVTGADLVPALVELAHRKKYTVFFLGGREGVASQAVENLRHRYPGLDAHAFCPEFADIFEMHHDRILQEISRTGPHMLFVSLGAGKAEKWIRMQLRDMRIPVCIGVGATVDFLAGEVLRAPRWMQRTGLEWFFRMLQEPRRLFTRYFNDFWLFAIPFLHQWLQDRTRRLLSAPTTRVAQPSEDMPITAIDGRLDAQHAPAIVEQGLTRLHNDSFFALDLSATTFIDSSGLGALVQLEKTARETESMLALIAPSTAVRSILQMSRLTTFFSIFPDLAAARAARTTGQALAVTDDKTLTMQLNGRLDALNAQDTFRNLSAALDSHPGTATCDLDLQSVTFMDSSGLSGLITFHRKAQSQGTALRILNVSDPVSQIFRLTKIDRYLTVIS